MSEKLQNYSGTRDYLGQEAAAREWVVEKVVEVFKRFGFESLETPIIEYQETLIGKTGGETAKQIYTFNRGDDKLGLRFDLTVPLARVVGQYAQKITLPYRRYALGPAFRAEKPQAGRLRQFTQLDVDIVGEKSVRADAEIIWLCVEVLKNLGLKGFVVEINNRKLLNAMATTITPNSSKQIEVMRACDKLSKKSLKQVLLELRTLKFTQEEVAAFENLVAKIQSITGSSQERLVRVRKMVPGQMPQEGFSELDEVFNSLEKFGVNKKYLLFNPLLARGLDYYTGPVFEMVVSEAGVGSLGGGGRYDNLITGLGGPNLPATGVSFGLERLMLILDKLGLLPKKQTQTQVFVTVFDPADQELLVASAKLAALLRETGFRVEIYLGKDKIGEQLKIADQKGIPTALILGPEELQKGTIIVKDLSKTFEGVKDKTLTQLEVSAEDLIDTIKKRVR